MCIRKYILILACCLTIIGCEKQKSDVPSYPVQFDINMLQHPYAARLVPDGGLQTVAITLTRNDMLQLIFSSDTIVMQRKEGDYIGYAGMVVWSDMNNVFHAADLCCPHCLDPQTPVEINNAFAECPTCGEQFDLMLGYALPTKGKTKQALRMFSVVQNGYNLHIHN